MTSPLKCGFLQPRYGVTAAAALASRPLAPVAAEAEREEREPLKTRYGAVTVAADPPPPQQQQQQQQRRFVFVDAAETLLRMRDR